MDSWEWFYILIFVFVSLQYKAFSELINQLSVREQIDAKSFLLMFGSYVIKPDDTPYSINYTLGKFICKYTSTDYQQDVLRKILKFLKNFSTLWNAEKFAKF